MNKAELRRHMRHLRDDAAGREAASQRICAMAADMAAAGETAFVYASVGSEVATGKLIAALWQKGCRVCLPVITGRGWMEAAEYRPGDVLVPDGFGIPTPVKRRIVPPEEIGIAFVPGLAFTPSGARLGYGGGYYDRFLARTGARRVGLTFRVQLLEELRTEEWDMPMDCVLCEDGSNGADLSEFLMK